MRFLITLSMLSLMALSSSPASAQCERFDMTTCTEHEYYLHVVEGDDFALDFIGYIPPIEAIPSEELDAAKELPGSEIIHWMPQWYDHHLQAENPLVLAKEALRHYVQRDNEQSRESALRSIEIIEQTPMSERNLLRHLYLIRMYQLLGELSTDERFTTEAEQAFHSLTDEALRRGNALPYDQGLVVKQLVERGDFVVLGTRQQRDNERDVIHVDFPSITFHVNTESGDTWLSRFNEYRQHHAEQNMAVAQYHIAVEGRNQDTPLEDSNNWMIRAANNGSVAALSNTLLFAPFVDLVPQEKKCEWVQALSNRGEDLSGPLFRNQEDTAAELRQQCLS